MRAYTKPIMRLERFTAKNAVATGCYMEDKTSIDAQNITCIIEGSEWVFAAGTTTGCQNDVSSGYFGYVKGTPYFLWYNGVQSTRPKDSQTAQLSAIETALGQSDAIGEKGWHAGIVSETQWSEMNSTS